MSRPPSIKTSPPSGVRKAEKSEHTRAAIVAAGLQIAKEQGLQAVSLTSVAKALGLSKGGVALRSGSLEQLQHMVLDEYEALFVRTVFQPAMAQPRGLPRLDALVNLWIGQGLELNTLLSSLYGMCAFTVDPAHETLRARLLTGFLAWQEAIEHAIKQAVELKQLRPDTDPEQLVFEIFGLMTSLAYAHLMGKRQVAMRALGQLGGPEEGALSAAACRAQSLARAQASYARLIWPYRSINL
jgi:AcrR family transcriptional regulator